MSIKPLVAALAALSLSGAAFAHGQQLQQSTTPAQARHAGFHASRSALGRALVGNSYEGYIPHHYLANMHGMWLGGFGQLTGTYNNNYMLTADTVTPNYSSLATPGTNATISMPHADVLVGYDSNHAGFLVDIGYANVATPTTVAGVTTIGMQPNFGVKEAYMTYAFNPMFGVKAGQFNPDFGSYDPTAALQSVSTFIEGLETVTGVSAVMATNGFHASATGAMVDKATTSGTIKNDAKPNTLILNAGYDMPFKGATVGIQGSYTNKNIVGNPSKPGQWQASNDSVWTVGLHYANDRFTVKGDVLNLRTKDAAGKTPWVWSASGDYNLNPQATAHQMTVGAYGDYLKNFVGSEKNLHWVLGGKFGYALNKFATADFYVQHAASRTTTPKTPSNTTAMVALSVKV